MREVRKSLTCGDFWFSHTMILRFWVSTVWPQHQALIMIDPEHIWKHSLRSNHVQNWLQWKWLLPWHGHISLTFPWWTRKSRPWGGLFEIFSVGSVKDSGILWFCIFSNHDFEVPSVHCLATAPNLDKYSPWKHMETITSIQSCSKLTFVKMTFTLTSVKLTQPSTQHSTAEQNRAEHSTAQHSTTPLSTAKHNQAQHTTAQQSRTKHSADQHSTTQHSIIG